MYEYKRDLIVLDILTMNIDKIVEKKERDIIPKNKTCGKY